MRINIFRQSLLTTLAFGCTLLFALLSPRQAAAAPLISEIFYNPPGGSESAYEWFEIYNPGPGVFDLSGLKIVSGSTSSPKQGALSADAGLLDAGAYAVISKSADLGDTCRVAQAFVVQGDFGLNNSSAQLALYAADQTVLVEANALDYVKYASAGFPASTNGQAIALQDSGADNYIGSNWALVGESDCMRYATATTGALYGTPGRANDWCDEDAGAPEPTCLPLTYDAGPGDLGMNDLGLQDVQAVDVEQADAGFADSAVADSSPHLLDAGPQNMPVISLSEPANDQSVGAGVDIVYSASDPDDDAVSVALYYDVDDSGNDGVLIVAGLEAQGSYTWTAADVPAGRYHVFGRALDARGGLAYAYAAGEITVPVADVEAPQLDILSPAQEELADKDYTISFSTNAVPGSVSLYYDRDTIEGEAIPIVGGLTVPDGPEHVVWDVEQVADGKYYIYGRYETAVGQVSAFSAGTVVVQHGEQGCACAQGPGSSQVWLVAFFLTFLTVLRRGRGKVVS